MARKPRWEREDTNDGVLWFHLSSWGYFEDFIRQLALDHNQLVWRGQASSEWSLESTLDRQLRLRNLKDVPALREDHLRRFKLSSRGRRGPNPATVASENDWWALGQHYGLATPLLDWSTSPYVAAFFAFWPHENGGASRRAVIHISKASLAKHSQRIARDWKAQRKRGQPPIVEFVEPLSDENDRLVNQGGLFTRAPDGMTLEQWSQLNYRKTVRWIGKITIPDRERDMVLKTLNRMNINPLSLFPDLGGASSFANLALQLDHY
jgi:hypothetical protein